MMMPCAQNESFADDIFKLKNDLKLTFSTIQRLDPFVDCKGHFFVSTSVSPVPFERFWIIQEEQNMQFVSV